MVTTGPRVAVRTGCAMENLMIVPEIIRCCAPGFIASLVATGTSMAGVTAGSSPAASPRAATASVRPSGDPPSVAKVRYLWPQSPHGRTLKRILPPAIEPDQLPDPQRHTAREWPAVVRRMEQHMSWADTVVGAAGLRTEPVLRTGEIIRSLQRYARKDASMP